ncbi:hypothetical protein A2U01_0114381, partial [Trifolium medium]|nr:hypothetical protein [Trifolium medium]
MVCCYPVPRRQQAKGDHDGEEQGQPGEAV